jgi:hypothetical protein
VDRPEEPLDYESVTDAPRRIGPFERTVRDVLAALGFTWFALWFMAATGAFMMRGLGDEPGSPVTVPRALFVSFMLVLIGALGLGVAYAAQRLGR